jgi:hypothetical protein
MALMVYYLTFQNINKTIQNLGDIDQTLSKHHKENNAAFALIFKNQDKNEKNNYLIIQQLIKRVAFKLKI